MPVRRHVSALKLRSGF